ncbi:hypothetical protein ND16A_1204 [Thalassotalea sp. ND16A]|nr:hypothetical protein ND16A_1204 [Thalassotalea sp. ND16A]
MAVTERCSKYIRIFAPAGAQVREDLFLTNLLNSQSSHLSLPHKKTSKFIEVLFYGGDGEIRTLERFPFTHFPGVLLQPLGHVT